MYLIDNNVGVRELVCTDLRKEEYRWFCPNSYGVIPPQTFLEALMADGQAGRDMKVRHNFNQDWDDQHPVCPLRAYQDVEIHDS